MLPSNWFENSACKGCESGERVTGGIFCIMTQGLVPTGYQGCKAQNDFYDDQRKEEMGITLNEFAIELRKILCFRWLTLDFTGYITLWKLRPKYGEDFPRSGKTWRRGDDYIYGMCGYIFPKAISIKLNLEEYTDKNGAVDYSKCIVEVE